MGGVFQPREREGKVVGRGGLGARLRGVGVEDCRIGGGWEDGGAGRTEAVKRVPLELVGGREGKAGKDDIGVVVIDGCVGSGGGGSSSVGSTISPQSSSSSSASVVGFGGGAPAVGVEKAKVDGDAVG